MNTAALTLVNGHEALTMTELIPYSPPKESCDIRQQFIVNTVHTADDTDALEAVKLDPAVLEARVTIDTTKHQTSGTNDSTEVRGATPRESSKSASFKDMVMTHEAALLSLTPTQYDLLLKFAATLRRQRQANQMNLECAFCKNNGESVSWYTSHALRCWRGRVQCPVLRAYRCPRCGSTGDRAHTLRYCPLLGNIGQEYPISQISGGCP